MRNKQSKNDKAWDSPLYPLSRKANTITEVYNLMRHGLTAMSYLVSHSEDEKLDQKNCCYSSISSVAGHTQAQRQPGQPALDLSRCSYARHCLLFVVQFWRKKCVWMPTIVALVIIVTSQLLKLESTL